jgi:hypothetical protein
MLTGWVKKYDLFAWRTCMVEKQGRHWEKKLVSLKRQVTVIATA